MLNNQAALYDAGVVAVGDFESIQTYVMTGAQSSVTFSSIPSTYKHLQVRIIGNVSTDGNLLMRVGNGSADSGSNYSWHQMYGAGSGSGGAVSGASSTQMYFASMTNGSNIFGASIIDILDYADTNKYKTIRGLDGYDANGSGVVDLASGSWRNTAAINTIEFRCAANFNQYSSFALYGIKG